MPNSHNTSDKVCLFLVGVFSMTQVNVVGWIGISELVFFIVAPFLFIRNYRILYQHGFTTVLWLAILMFLGGAFANWYNNINYRDGLRGLASCYAIFAVIVCLHALLYRNLDNMKWLLVGIAISGVICTFVFVPGADRMSTTGEVLTGSAATAHRMEYSLFWFAQLSTWALLPIQGFYLSCPLLYSIFVSIVLIINALFSAGSRSGFAILVGSLALMLIGGKKVGRMVWIRHHFIWLCFLGIIGMVMVGTTYKVLAKTGALGEGQYKKYLLQTSRGSGMLQLLMSGRSGFFAAFSAAIDQPIVGHGAWAIDKHDYYRKYLEKYGSREEIEEFLASDIGRGEAEGLIPGHSEIMVAWTWYGITGLVFWLYVLALYWNTLRKRMSVIPQWFGYFCIALPTGMWALFFSPFGSRIPSVLLFVLCLFVKAVYEKRMMLPPKMSWEIRTKAM